MLSVRGSHSIIKYIMLHPCTLYEKQGVYRSNVRSHTELRVETGEVEYAHSPSCSKSVLHNDVFIPLVVKLLLRGIYVHATDVLFVANEAMGGEKPPQCDVVAHNPVTRTVFCIFLCPKPSCIARTRAHAQQVLRTLTRMTPPDSKIRGMVFPLYGPGKPQQLSPPLSPPRRTRS
jgi:hypothetical protein